MICTIFKGLSIEYLLNNHRIGVVLEECYKKISCMVARMRQNTERLKVWALLASTLTGNNNYKQS